jgi:hypothetical protein
MPGETNELRLPSITESTRNGASDLQRETAAKQSEYWERAVLTAMQRSGDNIELVNAMRDFATALEHRTIFGDPEQPLSPSQQADLVGFLGSATAKLSGIDESGQHTGWHIPQ